MRFTHGGVYGTGVLQHQGLVAGGSELLQLLGLDDDILVGGVFVAPDDGGGRDGAVAGAVLAVGDALAAVGMQKVELGSGRAVDRGLGPDRDGDEADAE
jgi:hypothetical protein